MSKNSSRVEQEAMRRIDRVLELDTQNPHALPGSVVKLLKDAKRTLSADIRKRRDARDREWFRRASPEML